MTSTGVRCSYCGDGPYRKDALNPDGSHIGEYIGQYWFCQWCFEYGLSDTYDRELKRREALQRRAEANNALPIRGTF